MQDVINVLIVDDSPTVCQILSTFIKEDSRFCIQAIAENGLDAIGKAETFKPDLIIMDVNMPVMDGPSATEKILTKQSPAVVAFTTEDSVDIACRCLEAGALEVIGKPDFSSMDDTFKKNFLERLYQISLLHKKKNIVKASVESKSDYYEMLLIGASTGGPSAIHKVLKGLGKDFPLPIIITQHIDTYFDKQLINWINSNVELNVKCAEDGETLIRGNAYFAPAGKHLCIEKGTAPGSYKAVLNDEAPVSFLKPSVDKMFMSSVPILKNHSIALLLTGMGKDGAEGLKQIKDAGGYTICESESSCVVFGMPKAAIDLGAAKAVLPLEEIADYINAKVRNKTMAYRL